MRKSIILLGSVFILGLVNFSFAEDETKGKGKKCDKGKRFAKADTNGDGSIDQSEFKGPAEMFAKLDANGDGSITKEEMKAKKGECRKGKGKGHFFKKMDKDGNGSIEKAEFKGGDERFAKLDTNGDGSITKEEMKEAMKNRKKSGKRKKRRDGDSAGEEV